MNLSIAKVTEENGSVVLKFSSGTIPLSEKKGNFLRELGYVGKEVFTGVRPDKVAPAKNGENGEITGELIGGERSMMRRISASVSVRMNSWQRRKAEKISPERRCPSKFPATMCTSSTKKQKKSLQNNQNIRAGRSFYGDPVCFFSEKYKKILFFFVILH